MSRPSFESVWTRIKSHQGETFRQIRGGEFTYTISGATLYPDRVNRVLPKSHFKRAYKMCPLPNTVPVQKLQGPSYLYAILMDPRIREIDW